MSSPSAETTIVWMTPGTLRTKFETSQLRFSASLLRCAISAPGYWRIRLERDVALLGPWRSLVAPALVLLRRRLVAPALETGPVARQYAANLVRRSAGRRLGGPVLIPVKRRPRGQRRGHVHPRDPARQADPRLLGDGRRRRGGWCRRRPARLPRGLQLLGYRVGSGRRARPVGTGGGGRGRLEPVGAGRLEDRQADVLAPVLGGGLGGGLLVGLGGGLGTGPGDGLGGRLR